MQRFSLSHVVLWIKSLMNATVCDVTKRHATDATFLSFLSYQSNSKTQRQWDLEKKSWRWGQNEDEIDQLNGHTWRPHRRERQCCGSDRKRLQVTTSRRNRMPGKGRALDGGRSSDPSSLIHLCRSPQRGTASIIVFSPTCRLTSPGSVHPNCHLSCCLHPWPTDSRRHIFLIDSTCHSSFRLLFLSERPLSHQRNPLQGILRCQSIKGHCTLSSQSMQRRPTLLLWESVRSQRERAGHQSNSSF